jgi:hypothetical protein
VSNPPPAVPKDQAEVVLVYAEVNESKATLVESVHNPAAIPIAVVLEKERVSPER